MGYAALYRRGRVVCVAPSTRTLVDVVFVTSATDFRAAFADQIEATAEEARPDHVTFWPFHVYTAEVVL